MDTLGLRIKTGLPTSATLRKDGFRQKGIGHYKNITNKNDARIPQGCTIKLQTSNLYGDYFSAEFSAPKLLYGTNVEMIKTGDVPFVLDSVTDIVNSHSSIEFDANFAEIVRLDFCHNLKLQSETDVYAYLSEMKARTYPHKKRSVDAKENGVDTIYFYNKLEEVLFYGKQAETKNLVKKGLISPIWIDESYGKLRWEHRLKDKKKVSEFADLYGCDIQADSFLQHLAEMTKTTFENDMNKLDLERTIEVTGQKERARILQEFCGNNKMKFESLQGFLFNCDLYGVENLVAMNVINPNTFRKRKLEIQKAGLSFSLPTKNRILPPLRMANDELGFNKTKSCSLWNTNNQNLINTAVNLVA